ncbi:diguanylate cyclase/phosphodiesterase [Actinoalloteichus spitiensis]|uniref:diguanylate cyclase/phosphodiesterase n=1 Tax=Actinoalloteichus spitiensis TaxID=252394 RepID=UPI001B7F7CD0|nr:diguanylate cyclase/phosphodiesterase [Actinoalloteichus spitiensis]
MRAPLSRLRSAVLGRPRRRVPARVHDVQSATLRYLVYGLLPAWFIPGLLDWAQHRRTDIEHTAGVQESLIHALMMTEVGVPIVIALLCEINPLVLVIILGAILAHEATALWDVTTAEESGREVRPVEQHIHSFLESMPFMACGALACLHWEQIQALVRGARNRGAWTLRLKRPPLPTGYLAGVGGAILGLIALPYGEELVRCLRARRRRSATAAA